MSNSILIVTPYFAPQTHAAVFRVHKLTKYLKRRDWNPIVLTVDQNYLYNEDTDLLEELNGVPIYQSRYIEPTFRGLRMALGGRDRTFKTLKGAERLKQSQDRQSSNGMKWSNGFKKFIYEYLQESLVAPTDSHWTWLSSATKLGNQLIDKYKINIVYTTCLPFTCNCIGNRLKLDKGVKWVADFRDPITYAARMHSTNNRIYGKQRRIQDMTFQNADAITVLSSSYQLIFHDQRIGAGAEKVNFIPTGIDDDYLPDISVAKSKDIVFVGEYLKEYDDYLLQCIKDNIETIRNKNIRIKIIGNLQINSRLLNPILKRLNISDAIELIDHQSQRSLYTLLNNCWFVLIMSGPRTLWWCNYAKMVDYIGLQKHVLALVPELSEAKKELTAAGLGLFAHSREELSTMFRRIITDEIDFPTANSTYCRRYLASNMTEDFINVFEGLMK